MLSEQIGIFGRQILDAIVRGVARLIPNPNVITFIGLLINIWCSYLYGMGLFFQAGLWMIFANLFDMLDGRVARLNNRVTSFGAFFDSVMDRYSDVIVLVGIMTFYARRTESHSTLYVALTGIALMGSVMISYTRARAESLINQCKVGFLERPERVVLLIIGSLTEIGPESNPFLHKMRAVLWILAVMSHWTVVHRMYYTLEESKRLDAALKGEVETTPETPEPSKGLRCKAESCQAEMDSAFEAKTGSHAAV